MNVKQFGICGRFNFFSLKKLRRNRKDMKAALKNSETIIRTRPGNYILAGLKSWEPMNCCLMQRIFGLLPY
ncbi:MAG: hypothetical protein D3924_09625 [Candidatus Electrothrix sp. AR4]|nr:hypothetical protein [Candidatus Electrothrix sp. AR4]